MVRRPGQEGFLFSPVAPVVVSGVLLALSLIAALRAGIELNPPPIGLVDSVAQAKRQAPPPKLPASLVTGYMPSSGPPPTAEKFQPPPLPQAHAFEFVCAETRLQMGGWVADPELGAPIARVELYVDRLHVADAALGLPRPDVAAYFRRPDFEPSGWQVDVPTRDLSEGYHYLELWAVDQGGALHLLFEPRLHCLSTGR